MLARVSGPVLRVDAREGVSNRTSKPYRIPFVTVLVQSQGVAEVNVPDLVEASTRPGDTVDWLVEVTAFGGTPQARFVDVIGPDGSTPLPYPLGESASVLDPA